VDSTVGKGSGGGMNTGGVANLSTTTVVSAQSGGSVGPEISLLRRSRRASMQDALDFTKFNASLYDRPVRYNNLLIQV